MFGAFRYILAMMVVYGHLHPIYMKEMNWTGHYAVLSFYVLSGYLMTLVLNRRYGFSPGGFVRYFVNRALRIYPPYWAALGISAVIVAIMPEVARSLGPRLRFPLDTLGWVRNIVIFGLHVPQPARLVPPSWSLGVELLFYLVMGIGLSRSRWTVGAWLLASLGYCTYAHASGWAFYYRWMTPWGSSLAFALGAAIFFASGLRRPMWLLWPALAAFSVNTLYTKQLFGDPHMIGIIISLSLTGCIVWLLSGVRPRDLPPRIARIDEILGDLAYPIFLCHFQLAAPVVWCVFGGRRPLSLMLFFAALPIVHIVAYLIHQAVERPVASVRDRVRPAGQGVGAAASGR